MKVLVPMLAAAAFLSGCGGGGPVAVRDAVVTLPAVPGQAGAAYFTVEAGREPVSLTAIESPRIGRIELHQSVNENGVSRMRPLGAGDAEIASGRPLVFEPGGKHAMLYDVDPALRPGDLVSLTFNFTAVGPVTAEAEVRGPGQAHNGH